MENNDIAIYTSIYNFFESAYSILMEGSNDNSFIKKTIGIQGLFDFLRILSKETLFQAMDISVKFYNSYLEKVRHVDFSDNYYQASGVGRSRIKNTLLYANRMISDSDLKDKDLGEIRRIFHL